MMNCNTAAISCQQMVTTALGIGHIPKQKAGIFTPALILMCKKTEMCI
jgi:hypothetical protein